MEINIFPMDGHKEGLLFLLLNQREETTPQIMRLFMIIPCLAKLYGTILENNTSIWLECHG